MLVDLSKDQRKNRDLTNDGRVLVKPFWRTYNPAQTIPIARSKDDVEESMLERKTKKTYSPDSSNCPRLKSIVCIPNVCPPSVSEMFNDELHGYEKYPTNGGKWLEVRNGHM